MSRITHIDGTPTQQRNAIRRTIAEILRRLTDKRNICNLAHLEHLCYTAFHNQNSEINHLKSL